MPIQILSSVYLTGDVTTVDKIGPRPPQALATMLGINPARFAQGYSIAVLAEKLEPEDFEFGGTTLRSGGRLGLPLRDETADQNRTRVHDQIVKERGQTGYQQLQKQVLAGIPLKGPRRIAKVLTELRHQASMTPDIQYPMGGGALQWKIVARPGLPPGAKPGRKFIIALNVYPDGTADAGRFKVSLSDSQPYQALMDARRKIRIHLESI
ncbi:MAG: hypothetical protein K5872_16410 [Rhizobiaceae bacterium]|nr:hypothetical protein [Rhizobiaceae bacterium]MCV0407805.1 hypothetical protein [Rhizobiaceae bacterium]